MFANTENISDLETYINSRLTWTVVNVGKVSSFTLPTGWHEAVVYAGYSNNTSGYYPFYLINKLGLTLVLGYQTVPSVTQYTFVQLTRTNNTISISGQHWSVGTFTQVPISYCYR